MLTQCNAHKNNALLLIFLMHAVIPENGGVMTWVQEAFGYFPGFFVGFSYVITYILDISLYPVMFATYLNEAIGYEMGPWVSWAISASLVVVLTIVNLVGVQIVGAVSFLFLLVVISPFLIIPILGIQYLNPAIWFKGAQTFPTDAYWGYMLTLLIWNNSGWMSPGFLAGETKQVRRTYPRAMMTSMILAGVTYVVPLAIGICVDRDWANWDIGIFATVGEKVGGEWLKLWIIIASMFTNAGLFNSAMTTSSRSIAAMADNGYFPKIFGCEVPYIRTPFVGVMIDCIVTLILIRLPFSTLIGAQTCINSMTMIILYAAFIYFRFKDPNRARPFKVPLNNFLCILFVLPPVFISAYNIVTAYWISQVAWAVVTVLAIALFPILCRQQFKELMLRVKSGVVSCYDRIKGRKSAESAEESDRLVAQ